MASSPSVALLWAGVALATVAGLRFRATQNAGRARGGRISNPKVLWLFFAIWFWFVECAVLAFEPRLPWPYRVVLGSHAVSMWVRGVIELYMLNVSKTWRPPIGIAHDALCIATTAGLAAWFGPRMLELGAWGRWAPALVVMLVVSLAVELLYAALFFQAVEGKTTGEDGIWFADPESERFRRINRITFACNTPQVLFQLALLGAMTASS
ncbi:MAG: hypothetical protein INH41_24545 [Myxococcaceae bacterium]|jgi:hypothetical protein|nr:hypothetical protein [Myxococcaceae bacterium]MCA3015571.1 hypothetical protein [Myxococcaceae bacterium]